MIWSEEEEEGPVSESDSSLHPKAGSRALLERSPLRDNTALERLVVSRPTGSLPPQRHFGDPCSILLYEDESEIRNRVLAEVFEDSAARTARLSELTRGRSRGPGETI